MSRKRPAKTEGFTWLEHSINAFNGSGYRDDASAEDFIESYINYKKWKKQETAVQLAQTYYYAVLPLAEHLVNQSAGANTTPNPAQWIKWQTFCSLRNTKLL